MCSDLPSFEQAFNLFSKYAQKVELETRQIIQLVIYRNGSGILKNGTMDKEIFDFHDFSEFAVKLAEHMLDG